MSLVGPRPERPEIVKNLRQVVPGYDRRHTVKPGITGFAQIHLPPDSCIRSVKNKLAYDLYYIAAMGPWLDVRILLGTGLKVVGVPFPVVRKLFFMPAPAVVEDAYRRLIPAADPVPQVQIA